MYNPITAIIIFILYIGCLFLIALWVERKSAEGKSLVNNAVVYSLSIAVYCTSWTYYGSVGNAATSGMLFLTYFLGPTIAVVLWWTVLRKMVRVKNAYRITSIADFISARYNKSEGLAALVTLVALAGIIPYIALQLVSVHNTLAIITTSKEVASTSWIADHVGSIVVVMMILFTIMIGVRKLDPTERHEGMVMALAVECMVKLIGFCVAGIFVTYFIYDGFGDIFQRLLESPFSHLMSIGGSETSPYLMWVTYLILSMFAVMFLPRQFHVAVVENSNEKHILTAMWLFPLYLILINIFVFPVAMGGLLKGLPVKEADMFVLELPLYHGKPWLAMLVFMGGFSAATGMIMISAMTLSTMITNHFLLPMMRWIKWLSFLQRHLLKCKWAAVALVILFGYGFELLVGKAFMLVNIGMISFAAVLQFAPALLGGIFWPRGNKTGAFLGLGSGFLVWFYTLLLPVFVTIGWLPDSLLTKGPWGIEFLNPEKIFGLGELNSLTHTVFWSMLFNIGFYILGSLYFRHTNLEKSLADEFMATMSAIPRIGPVVRKEANIDLKSKKSCLENLLARYFTSEEVSAIMSKCYRALGLHEKSQISITELVKLHNEVEKHLAGSVGAAAAHKVLTQGVCFTPRETKDLMEMYREVFAKLRVSPEELHEKIDYYQEKEKLLTDHFKELENLNEALELRIAEQEEAEKALAISEKKYRSIFENAPEGIFQSTPQGRFISASPSLARILGYDSAVDLIETVSDIGTQVHVVPGKREEFLRLLREQGTVKNFECQFYRKDGSKIWISIQARAIRDQNGNLIAIEGFNQDISERKRAEEALQNAYKDLENRVEQRTAELRAANEELLKAKAAAEAATRSKSEFLANMSHEIRTPMNAVIAASDLAMGEELPPKIKHYIQIIHSSAYSLLGLINDILDFSKIEAGKLVSEKNPFWLDQVMDRVIEVFISRAAEKKIELLVDIDIETPKALIGDAFRFQQILTNLLSNAVKFTEKGGVILVGVKILEKFSDQVTLEIFVRDTGVGIAPEHLRILFRPFTQADASTTRKYGGTGLGLAISKQLVEMMDGRIWAESELGKGSTFYFTVRFGLQAAVEERKLVAPPDISGMKVLVADDCADSRVIIQKMLESFGFRVETAVSGDEVIGKLENGRKRQDPFELVIIDWMMPKLDGIGTSRKIRKNLKLPLPIILMTAFGKETEKLNAEKAGINVFLTKPIFPSTLFDAIMDAFGKAAMKTGIKKKAIITKATLYKNRLKGTRILVAEDNFTNQEIALAILEGAGICAEIAKNGKEAVNAVRRRKFDAVLMDIQMPEMDGYEATREIRKDSRFKSLPIIAMTAHAMKGDEEKCLDAGMDGYVSKPIDQDRLFHVIWKLIEPIRKIPTATEAEAVCVAPAAEDKQVEEGGGGELPSRLPGINIQNALNALNIEEDVFKRILIGFLKTNEKTMDKIKECLVKKDWKSLQMLVHSLKGSAANIGADDLREAALLLETETRAEIEKPPSSAIINNLETKLNEVLRSLQSLSETPKIEKSEETEIRPDHSKLVPMLQELAHALEMANPEEIEEKMEAVREHLSAPTLKLLASQVDAYDYDEALETIEQIQKSIEGQTDKKGDGRE